MHFISVVFIAFHLFRVFKCVGRRLTMEEDSAFVKRYVEVHFNVEYGITMPM